ncbi:MAG TPA: putative Ig domain-containing protein [Steroidobacteraceae bacterium]|nr:putative Ig domain-containing protein [Steroidobacteraceae bacterium]
MQHSNTSRAARTSQLLICACALAALFAGTTAHARNRWWAKPSISGSPSTTDVVGQAYRFTPTASAPNGMTLTFAISGKPSWASFSSATGQLAGTPTAAGNFSNIVITVSDGAGHASLAPFSIAVTAPVSPPSAPPTISGTPPTTDIAGTAYAFTPQASDPSGNALSFSVQNKPSWASFSIATGALSGTPSTTNVGTYSNIVISVSDGTNSAALAPFSINVTQPASPPPPATATLTWTAPTTNTDGSAVTNLAGYHIYYGTTPSSLTTVIDVGNPATTSYTVNNLSSGTWYFAVNAYTTGGVDSALSNTGTKSIP